MKTSAIAGLLCGLVALSARVPQLVGRRIALIGGLSSPNAWFGRVGSCAHASAGRQRRRFALSGGGEGGHGGGWGHLAGGKNARLGGVERGDVHDAAGTPGEGDGMDAA